MTLEKFYEYWKTEKAPDYLTAATIQLYDYQFIERILPLLGKKKLDNIRRLDARKLVEFVKCKTKGSPRQCRICLVALSSVLRTALELDLIAQNPTYGVKTPKYTPKEKELWSMEELSKFLHYAKENDPLYPIYLIIARYGLRGGESLGIRFEDIELGDGSDGNWGTLHIRQQIVTLNG